MDAYRDQYAKVFHGGKDIVVLAVSIDPADTLAAWAKDKGYPVTFLSDPGAVMGKKYGATYALPDGTVLDNRTLFIVDKRGKIAKVMAPFREIDPTAYTELGEAIDKVIGMK